METAITALFVIGVMLLAITGISNRALTAQAEMTDAGRVMLEREGDRMRTVITPMNASVDETGTLLQFAVRNSGSTWIGNFGRWDVMVEYADGVGQQVGWYPYGYDVNQWTAQIFQDVGAGLPEVFDPDILDPGEEFVVTVKLAPAVAPGTTNRITVATANGVSASAIFLH